MNGVQLFLLGRTLMKIGEEAIPAGGVGKRTTGTRSVLIVMLDVYASDPAELAAAVALLEALAELLSSEMPARLTPDA
ncbi:MULTISPECIES: hypothetical protein [unclassified Streptomyces]|uniref:hypothetical protein n=1 Tax=unclassified Streptomyces TaxID=2593676 RepID=UPI003327BBD6